jgi:23S rRNA pseudouridine2605 synthase
VREIRGKVLRDQLGQKLARAAGVDFAAPERPPLGAAKPAREDAGAHRRR